MVRCSMPDVEDRARAVIPAGLFGLAPGPLTQGDPMTASTESSSVSSIEVLGPLEPGFEEILIEIGATALGVDDFLSTAHGAEESTEAARTYILPYDARTSRVVVTKDISERRPLQASATSSTVCGNMMMLPSRVPL